MILSTIAGTDYVTLDEVLTFNIGEERQDIFVDIINDTIAEDIERFTVNLKVTDDDPDVRIFGFQNNNIIRNYY